MSNPTPIRGTQAPDKKERCGSCKFSLPVGDQRVACRRYPPHVLVFPIPVQAVAGGDMKVDWTRQAASFPTTHPDMGWCGEWQAAPPAIFNS